MSGVDELEAEAAELYAAGDVDAALEKLREALRQLRDESAHD